MIKGSPRAILFSIRHKASGMSLVEVLIALTIIAVSLLAIFFTLTRSMKMTDQNVEFAAVKEEARIKLEEFVGMKLFNRNPGNLSQNYRDNSLSPFGSNNIMLSPDNNGVVVSVLRNTATVNTIREEGFDVYYMGVRDDPTNPYRLEGLGGQRPGEVVIIMDETLTAEQYGRDLDNDNVPDGVQFTMPLDLDGDGVYTPGSKQISDRDTGRIPMRKIPIGVIIRWINPDRKPERYETWTVINAY